MIPFENTGYMCPKILLLLLIALVTSALENVVVVSSDIF